MGIKLTLRTCSSLAFTVAISHILCISSQVMNKACDIVQVNNITRIVNMACNADMIERKIQNGSRKEAAKLHEFYFRDK